MFCTYPLGHGGPACLLKKSTDGGLTWGDRLPVPKNWETAKNCPCIHRLIGLDGVERLIVLEGNGDMRQSISVDNGETWTPFEPNGLHCIVVPNRVIPISDGRYIAIYVDHGTRSRGDHVIMQSITADGGLTWETQRLIAQHEDALPDEPGVIGSPDGKQIMAVMREQSRAYNAMVITSDDEGQTWSECREAAAGVTGDRHNLAYAPDGRLVIVFRDTALASSTKFNFVAWVGTYDDLINGREGEYRVLLLRHQGNFPARRIRGLWLCRFGGAAGRHIRCHHLSHSQAGRRALRRQRSLQSGGVGCPCGGIKMSLLAEINRAESHALRIILSLSMNAFLPMADEWSEIVPEGFWNL